jgi:hypothetical protein
MNFFISKLETAYFPPNTGKLILQNMMFWVKFENTSNALKVRLSVLFYLFLLII